MNNAEKLLQAANSNSDGNGEGPSTTAASMAAATQAATKAFLLCEPCIARCHNNHKGVRFMYEQENNSTSVYCMCIEVGKITQQMCCAMQISTKQMQLQLDAENMRAEMKRHRQRNIDQPPIFACVPRVNRRDELKTRAGWQLCRQCAPPAQVLAKQVVRKQQKMAGQTVKYSLGSDDEDGPLMVKAPNEASSALVGASSTTDRDEDYATDTDSEDESDGDENNGGNDGNDADTATASGGEEDAADESKGPASSGKPPQRRGQRAIANEAAAATMKSKGGAIDEEGSVATASVASSMVRDFDAKQRNYLPEYEQLGWIEVFDVEEPEVLRYGDTVLCLRYGGFPRIYGRVRASPKPGFYLIRYDDRQYGEEVLDRGRLELVSRPRFLFHTMTGESSWSKLEDILMFQDMEAKRKLREAAQAAKLAAAQAAAAAQVAAAEEAAKGTLMGFPVQPPLAPDVSSASLFVGENSLLMDGSASYAAGGGTGAAADGSEDVAETEDERQERLIFEQMQATNPVRLFPSQMVCLDGTEWWELMSHSIMRRAFEAYDEMYCEELDMVFYCQHEVHHEEKCIRRLQTLFRSHFHRPFPFMPWSSRAFSFDVAPEVRQLMKKRFGWAYLRRRSQGIGEFLDVDGNEWEEYIDNKTSEYFYWQEDENLYVWDKPALFQRKQAPKNKFREGEEVYYRFPGRYKEELAVIAKVRFDDETGEDFYDVQHKVAEDQLCRWVPQVAIKAVLKDGEELKLAKLEQRWKDQIKRRREAEERKLAREKEQAIQYELERLEKMKSLAFRMHGDAMEAKRTGGISLTTRLMRGRMERVALEAKIVREEIDRVEGQSRRDKVQTAIAEVRSELGPKFTRSAMLNMQRSLDLKFMLEEKIAKRNQLQVELQAKREEAVARMQYVEETLRQQEMAMTTPRSVYRRKVIRKTHMAMKRQSDLFLICEWGCGEWLKIGHEQQDHQLRRCAKRILPCTLGCDMKHTEEYWLAIFDPAQLAQEEEERLKRVRTLEASQGHDQLVSAAQAIGGKSKPLRILHANSSDGKDGGTMTRASTRPSRGPTTPGSPNGRAHPMGGLGPHPSTASNNTVGRTTKAVLGSITRQQYHETQECPKRLVMCPLQCMEWVCAEILDKHTKELCPKRPAEPFVCRLGCGARFGGTVEQLIQAEEDRMEHENEECEYRVVRCNWVFDDGTVCAAQMRANERTAHRDYHITAMGVITYAVPGVYTFRTNKKNSRLKVQMWGGGGGSGCFKERQGGAGGGGAFMEAIIDLEPYSVLELTVGSGGQGGVFGKEMEAPVIDNLREMAKNRRDDTVLQSYRLANPELKIPWYDPERLDAIAPTSGYCGITPGGQPGGGIGYGGGGAWACGGGGGYTSIAKKSSRGTTVLLVAAGGGGGGSLPGLPGGALDGSLPGTMIDPINGTTATIEKPGEAGDTGSTFNAQWNGTNGDMWQGGYGCEFGAGGGGGYFGGGGGGTSPGLAGGGGGGSSYYYSGVVRDIVVISGSGQMPGGLKHSPPLACGVGDWDKVGGYAGQGGLGEWAKTNTGNNGAIRIIKPGHY